MANARGASSVRRTLYNGKTSLLPPKSPFPSIPPSYTEYIPASTIGPKTLPKPRDVNSNHHQRTASESFLIDDQPSWLYELLNEPNESPIQKGGHRRSSSGSFAYRDMSNAGDMNYMARDNPNRYKNVRGGPLSPRGSRNFDIYREPRENGFYVESNHFGRTRNKLWDSCGLTHGLPSPKGSTLVQSAGLSSKSQDVYKNVSLPIEKEDLVEPGNQDRNGPAEKEGSHRKPLEMDHKCAKQQFAQRSRVRKLQYIAELERIAQALQAEGSEVSAELEFINQQNLILNMENKALKQCLESLAEEQLIKCIEHKVLEREASRLRNLYQQQQKQPQTTCGQRRGHSRHLDQQFSYLSLKNEEAIDAGRDSVSGQQLRM